MLIQVVQAYGLLWRPTLGRLYVILIRIPVKFSVQANEILRNRPSCCSQRGELKISRWELMHDV